MTKKGKDTPSGDIQQLKKIISTLKSKLKNRDKKIELLRSEIKTLQAALDKSIIYINEELAEIPVEDIVRYFNRKKKGKINGELERLKDKWRCHVCESGYLRLMLFETPGGKKYLRACVNGGCKNKTRLKKWHPDVEGLE